MCSGGGGTRTEYVYQEPTTKAAPLPTPVSVSDVTKSASAERAATEEQRKRRGARANAIANDRETILGGLANAANAFRQTLG